MYYLIIFSVLDSPFWILLYNKKYHDNWTIKNMGALESELYLSKCQVDTPLDVVEGMWKLINQYRKNIKKVVDFGAGDGKFAFYGRYESYLGYEIDPVRLKQAKKLPENATVKLGCAFQSKAKDYDLCIGNPPYVRHHDIETEWQMSILSKLADQSGLKIDARTNAFTLFMLRALLATHNKGMVALLVPYEWVSRPSCRWLRDFITGNSWTVNIFKFTESLFPRVLTTASIVIIDKGDLSGSWEYHRLDRQFKTSKMRLLTGTSSKVIEYTRREEANYAQRGLSPGGQKVFCLNEGQRLHYGLVVDRDVIPCISSLKDVDLKFSHLTQAQFKKNYVDQGKRCWLIKPDPKPSIQLQAYLNSFSFEERDNYTTQRQSPWWCYREHQSPDIIYASSFTSWGPKAVINDIGAISIGSVHGIHAVKGISLEQLIKEIRNIDFEKKLVHHSGQLKKIEVNQMNTILKTIIGK